MRVNPFKLIDELIEKNYKVPIFESSIVRDPNESQLVPSESFKTVNLAEVLLPIKVEFFKLMREKEDLHRLNSEVLEDLNRIFTSGAVSRKFNRYYDNFRAVNEALKIRDKYFLPKGF